MIETDVLNTSLIWGFVILMLLVLTFIRLKTKKPLSYVLNPQFLSPAENNFYRVLEMALRDTELKIFAKVGLSDLFRVTTKSRDHTAGFNKIRSKHVDFLLCNKDMQPVAAIELDDRTHLTSGRTIANDRFKNELFTSAKLPLLRIKVKHEYDVQVLKTAILNSIEPTI